MFVLIFAVFAALVLFALFKRLAVPVIFVLGCAYFWVFHIKSFFGGQ